MFNKTESYLGVDIGAHGIKVVELRKTKGRPQLWTYGRVKAHLDIHPFGAKKEAVDTVVEEYEALTTGKKKKKMPAPDPHQNTYVDEYAELLAHVVKEAKVTTTKATASLPVSQVFHAIVTLPMVSEKEIDYHVRAKVKKMLPQSIDDMQIVHQIIPDKGEKKSKFLRILVTAAPKELVAFYSAIFAKAGLQLEELETEAFALERALVGHDQSTMMIIDVGAERSNFFIIDQGVPITHRSIHVGGNMFNQEFANILGIEEGLTNQMKKDLDSLPGNAFDPEVCRPILEPIIKEIQYSIEMFTSQTGNEGKRLEKIILTGGNASFSPIQHAIAEKFPIKVFVGDPWARVVYQQSLKHTLDRIGPQMAVSIGLAMRNIV